MARRLASPCRNVEYGVVCDVRIEQVPSIHLTIEGRVFLNLRAVMLLIVAALPATASAAREPGQTAPDRSLAEALLAAGKSVSDTARARQCGTKGPDGEITVCAPDDGKQWRVPSTSADDPLSATALRTGMPGTPEMGRGSCRGKPGCRVGGWAPAPVLIIDLSQIPETPQNSDADKVANGEMADR